MMEDPFDLRHEAEQPSDKDLDQALEAGLLCTKCIATKQGTKGCRACMGDFFEEIRLRGAKASL